MELGKSKKRAECKNRKVQLHEELSKAVAQIQTECSSSAGRRCVDPVSAELLCKVLEAIFLHEVHTQSKADTKNSAKDSNAFILPNTSFWSFIEPMVSDEIKQKLRESLRDASNVRKSRAWVRLSLSQGEMISFLEDLQRHPGLLASHYTLDALLRDVHHFDAAIRLLKGIEGVALECVHTDPKLNAWEPVVLLLAGVWSPPEVVDQGRAVVGMRGERVSPSTRSYSEAGVTELALDKHKPRLSRASDSGMASELDDVTDLPPPPSSSSSRSSSLANTPERPSSINLPSSRRHNIAHSLPICTPENPRGVASVSSPTRASTQEELELALSMEYGVIDGDAMVMDPRQEELVSKLKPAMFQLVLEQGIDAQDFKCHRCRRSIGIIFDEAKVCRFDGKHYCSMCSNSRERTIPGRVLFNWDFQKYSVCTQCCYFLDYVESEPFINMEEVNRSLYSYIPELDEAHKYRRQLVFLKDYLQSCKDDELLKTGLLAPYLYDNVHLYSMHDLVEVQSGQFNQRLKKAVKSGRKHVKQCQLCSQKGYVCEGCHNSEVIYPFDVDTTYQCPDCKSLYHMACRPQKFHCSRCIRLQKRKDVTA
eukprot:Em0008g1229a